MTYSASAQVAQKIKEALDQYGTAHPGTWTKGDGLSWLADESGVSRETTRRKIGKGAGDLTMGEITAYCRVLDLNIAAVTS